MSDNIVVYTSIVGDADKPRNDILQINDFSKFKKNVYNAKAPKILSHLFVTADISIWLDGNIFLNIPEDRLVKEFLQDKDMAVWKHPDRNCIYKEAREIKGLGGDRWLFTEEQVEHYKKNQFPENYGLAECGMIIRRHNNIIKKFNNEWWSEICRWSERDQLSFPYVLKNNGEIKCNFIEGNVRLHTYFRYIPHNDI